MVDWLMAYSVVMTLATAGFGYFWYRKREIISLAFEVIRYAKDTTKTEEEFLVVVDKLDLVLKK